MHIKLIQHINSSHIDEMINVFSKENVDFEAWFAKKNNSIKINIYNSNIYSTRFNLSFISYIFSKKNNLIIITGWMNVNMIIIILLFFLTNKLFFYWSDRPRDINKNYFKKLKRYVTEKILKLSNAKILCVGNTTIEYFKSKNFNSSNLINLPILTTPIHKPINDLNKKNWKKNNFGLNENVFLVSSGSRLEFEKGYDILIEAVSRLDANIIKNLIVIIVGDGNEAGKLKQQTIDLNVSRNFIFPGWLEINEFKSLISHSDLFIHPSRYDAYGASIYPLSLGVPVIGSINAGVIKERIINNFNGLVYYNNDPLELSIKISELIRNRRKLNLLGQNALKDSKKHHPLNYLSILNSAYNENIC